MVKKSVTLDDLAEMVNRGFDDVSSRMATKIDVDERFDGVDERFEQVDKRLTHIDLELGHMGARMDNMERDVAEIRRHFVYRDEFEDALARISLVEKKLGIKSGK